MTKKKNPSLILIIELSALFSLTHMDSFVGLFGPDTPEKNGSSNLSTVPEFLPPEAAEGNVEYKLKLINPSKSRFEHLVTQMKWRLREGQGEAIYTIGVSDSGKLIGLNDDEMQESLNTLYRMAEKLGADITSLGHSPHFAVLVISAVSGLSGIAKEHLGLATVVDIPIVVVINKIDIASPSCLKKTLLQLQELLQTPGYKKISFQVSTEDDAFTAASSFASDKIIPIFTVSCVTGKGLDLLYTFLNVLPPTINQKDRELLMQKPAEFQIDETFHVPEVGLVVSGLLTSGIIHEGDTLLVGPSDTGRFDTTKVLSLHRHKVPSRIVRACESATLALSSQNIPLRKGMVLISQQVRPPVCNFFQAKIQVLFHATNICSGFQASVHIGNIRQTATILGIMGRPSLSVNDTGSVIFKFIQRPECVHPGSKLLLRVGQTKAIGRVTQVFLLGDNLPLKVSPIHR
ncbi:GTP-binding protein 2 [Nephila pilipes]|uniref:GTP-binding protein 2 n=1 Tax=Nephila pilipes TaxID=299642 RepID=A0A8X6TC78_NEPPI|nr:GTP-binding protein 2 [Nephila pilipes]